MFKLLGVVVQGVFLLYSDMKKLIYIILFLPLLASGQSPQATRLFDFDFEKNVITIDTVIRFEGLSSKEIIDLSFPRDIAFDKDQNLYVSDGDNYRVLKIENKLISSK